MMAYGAEVTCFVLRQMNSSDQRRDNEFIIGDSSEL